MCYGSGDYIYRVDKNWASDIKIQYGIKEVAGLTIDNEDNIYVLTRSERPVIVLNHDGAVVRTFGEGIFGRAHGMCRNNNGEIYGVDDAEHVIYRFSTEGKLLDTLGTKGKPSDTGYLAQAKKRTVLRSSGPFNRPTRMVFDCEGNFYVTDGYGNARVHKFDKHGRLVLSWGEPGTGPGQFNTPHGIGISTSGTTLYVADRQNNRLQLFDPEGKLLDIWTGFHRPSDIFVREGILYIAENRRSSAFDNMPSRVSIMTESGTMLARLGADHVPYEEGSGYHSVHSIAVDIKGNIYIGDVGKNWPEGYSGLAKYCRVN